MASPWRSSGPTGRRSSSTTKALPQKEPTIAPTTRRMTNPSGTGDFMRSKNAAIVAASLVLAGCGASAGIASADPAAPRDPMTTMDHDATYSVGTDIVPGTYSSAG